MEYNNDTELELPTVTEVNRDLFAEEAENFCLDTSSFDVDKFLTKNNFHYVPLDSLIRDVSILSQEIVQALMSKATERYSDYLKFCEAYTGNDNDSVLELQRTRGDLYHFMTRLEQLTANDIPRTKEVMTDTIEYLQKIDDLGKLLTNHVQLSEQIALAKQLSNSLHIMCGSEVIEEQICTELTQQLNLLVISSHDLLCTLSSLSSPYVRHLRNEYQGLIQTFQIALKLLTEKCLEEPDKYRSLGQALMAVLAQSNSDELTRNCEIFIKA